MGRVLWVLLGGVAAAVVGGLAVLAFGDACSQFGYVPETAGQVAIGTGVYGLARQATDLLPGCIEEYRRCRALRRALVCALRQYMQAVGHGGPRDFRALEARMIELQSLHPVDDRPLFEQALYELRSHGEGGDFKVTGDGVQVMHMAALATRLGGA